MCINLLIFFPLAIIISGNRLFGSSPDFNCYGARWRAELGTITGEVIPEFLVGLSATLETFVFHFLDLDDSIETLVTLAELDIVECLIGPVRIFVWANDSIASATIFELPSGLLMQTDNLVQQYWQSRLFIEIPHLVVRSVVQTKNESKSLGDGPIFNSTVTSWSEVFKFESDLSACIYNQISNTDIRMKEQQDFLRHEDMKFKKAEIFYSSNCAKFKNSDFCTSFTEARQQFRSEKNLKAAYATFIECLRKRY
jgi:hypothetical protein